MLTIEIAFIISVLWHLHLNYYGNRLQTIMLCFMRLHSNESCNLNLNYYCITPHKKSILPCTFTPQFMSFPNNPNCPSSVILHRNLWVSTSTRNPFTFLLLWHLDLNYYEVYTANCYAIAAKLLWYSYQKLLCFFSSFIMMFAPRLLWHLYWKLLCICIAIK
jgi:hypothetical protein